MLTRAMAKYERKSLTRISDVDFGYSKDRCYSGMVAMDKLS